MKKETKKIAVLVLGNKNAGKSNTWYHLFGCRRNTGLKKLQISAEEVEVFLKNTSFEESGLDVDGFFDVYLKNTSFEECGGEPDDHFNEGFMPEVVLCSVQYTKGGLQTIEWFKKHGYYLYIQWLNPGYYDKAEYLDILKFEESFRAFGEFHKRSGKEVPNRGEEIRSFLTKRLTGSERTKRVA